MASDGIPGFAERKSARTKNCMAANEPPAWYATATEFASERTSERVATSGSQSRRASRTKPEESGVVRQIIDSLACLAVAVIVFRVFLLEGYIISTGSMAPSLLGYHKQVVCPDCQFEFAYGVAFDRPKMEPLQLATCPNCGQAAIDLTNVPRNDGDQLLVSKHAYFFGGPKRWEVVVFLNPNNPNQAYVKRVVGLPGETIHVRDGDVYINGRIQRKTIAQQRAIRIPVFAQEYQASHSNWIPRWRTDAEWAHQDSAFRFSEALNSQGNAGSGNSFGHTDAEPLPGTTSSSWVRYYHWPRLSPYTPPGDIEMGRIMGGTTRPDVITDHYGYNPSSRVPEKYRVNDLMLSTKLVFGQQGGEQQDDWQQRGRSETADDASVAVTGEFVARLSCRAKQVVCRIDADSRKLDLWVVGSSESEVDRVLHGGRKADATVPLREDWLRTELEFELSSFDRQAMVAVNGVELAVLRLDDELRDVPNGSGSESPEGDLSKITVAGYASDSGLQASESRPVRGARGIQQSAWTGGVEADGKDFAEAAVREQSGSGQSESGQSLSPVAFGARRGSVQVRSVTLYRDVHYTTENHRHATDRPLTLGDDEFFFLGDNSPVSLDSRGWVNPVVPRHLLVGRPLIVHLPSHPGRVKVGSMVKYIRVPDFSKIRCIR